MSGLIGLGANQMPTWGMIAPLLAGRKGPLKTTTYTSGTGTFTPAVPGGLCRVRIVPPGGSGARSNAGSVYAAGAGGASVALDFWVIFDAAQTYVVGAAPAGASANNTNGTAGGLCRLGWITAVGGAAGTAAGVGGAAITLLSPNTAAIIGGGGGGGGNGAAGTAGHALGGMPGNVGNAAGGALAGGYGGGGGGGDGADGAGGAGGAGHATVGLPGAAGSGYGSGGGGGGAGLTTSGNGGAGAPGKITIWEYGNV